MYKNYKIRPGAALLHKLSYSWLRGFQTTQQSARWIKTAHKEDIYRPKKRCTWTGSTSGTNLTKDTVKRQNSMKENSGVKEQYSITSIFGRIYQHCTTCEQKAFTLNHHLTTTPDNSRLYLWKQQTLPLKAVNSTSDNSRLPEDMPRFCIRVLFEECSGATTGEVFSSLNNLNSRPSNSVFQIARGSGATLSECTFSSKKRTSLRGLLQDISFQTT